MKTFSLKKIIALACLSLFLYNNSYGMEAEPVEIRLEELQDKLANLKAQLSKTAIYLTTIAKHLETLKEKLVALRDQLIKQAAPHSSFSGSSSFSGGSTSAYTFVSTSSFVADPTGSPQEDQSAPNFDGLLKLFETLSLNSASMTLEELKDFYKSLDIKIDFLLKVIQSDNTPASAELVMENTSAFALYTAILLALNACVSESKPFECAELEKYFEQKLSYDLTAYDSLETLMIVKQKLTQYMKKFITKDTLEAFSLVGTIKQINARIKTYVAKEARNTAPNLIQAQVSLLQDFVKVSKD
jgi:predicted component of type VI protein secretion system